METNHGNSTLRTKGCVLGDFMKLGIENLDVKLVKFQTARTCANCSKLKIFRLATISRRS